MVWGRPQMRPAFGAFVDQALDHGQRNEETEDHGPDHQDFAHNGFHAT